jgi:hypothetical protein
MYILTTGNSAENRKIFSAKNAEIRKICVDAAQKNPFKREKIKKSRTDDRK